MDETLRSHISFIQHPFLTKFVGLDSNSNLFLWLIFHPISRCYEDLAFILVQGGLDLDSNYFVRYETFFTIVKSFFDTRIIFHDFFLVLVCF